MARQSRIRRAYLKQKRSGVAELKLRDMNREAHARAASIGSQTFQIVAKDIFGIIPDDITRNIANIRRKFLGLDECTIQSSREEILARVSLLSERSILLNRIGNRATWLIRDHNNLYFFVYRVTGDYLKKSLKYTSRTTAMERYSAEKITWLHFFDEQPE